MKRVCVLMDEDYHILDNIRKLFEKINVSCIFITKEYSKKEGKIFDDLNSYDYTSKDFKITGSINAELMLFLDNLSCDALLSLVKPETLEHKYIVSRINSGIKVGINMDNYHIYDVIVKNKKGSLNIEFLEEMIGYLKYIKK